ncbi:hypothetical protein [Micromonospora sp. WMMD1082]|nr:hypothetical protein [Micromonospora sp. WMMD1082]MDG4798718.1 hypothetical protein [Micromonospora sp. WMMD1082]
MLDEFLAMAGCALFGFLAGLFAFRVKSRWCPECGATTLAGGGQRPDGTQ